MEGDIGDLDLAEQTLRRARRRRPLVNFASRIAQQPRGRRRSPACFARTNDARHPVAFSRRLAMSASRAFTTPRRVRSTATCRSSLETLLHRRVAVPAPHSVQRIEGRGRPLRPDLPTRRTELPVTITNCSNNYGPFQFPESDPALLRAERAWTTKPLLDVVASTPEPTRVASRARPLPSDRLGAGEGRGG